MVIRRLRRKFVFTNMCVIFLMLTAIFVAVLLFTSGRLAGDSERSMRMLMDMNLHSEFPQPFVEIGPPMEEGERDDKHRIFSSSFLVETDLDGNVIEVFGNVNVTDDNVLDDIIQICLSSQEETGILRGYNLRYLVRWDDTGARIVFSDRSGEINVILSLIRTSLIVGAVSLLIFWGISILLARWAIRPIEQSWEQQRRFVADASHELKTPLTVILANTDIVLSHRQDTVENQSKWLEYIRAEAQRMTSLVTDLLFLARSDDSRTKLILTEVNFSDIVWSGLLPFEPVAFEQKKTLESDIAPDLHVLGDENQLKQLVVILLDNACKHSGDHGRISVRLAHASDSAVFSVTNSGDPIPSEHLPHIFERFYRVDSPRARENGGYGLGLAIAKTIVESHHGKIQVHSNQETGTVFTVTIPTKGKQN